MNKNHFLNMMLLAALVFGLGMSVTSCKDNENDGKTEEQKQEEAQQKATKFWDVVAQLVSVDDVTDDYAGKTFEPTYGIADSSDPLTRIVNTNDMKTAAQRFANLVGVTGIDENTPSYTWNDPDVGTMTYTRGGTAAEWATVDVDIKAVPHLQKIIYRVGSEGDNGSFEGRAYYRFGDVVSRQVTVTYNEKKNNDRRGTITEYWICVRPAFGPEGKEDSHWVCVNTVGDKNYKYYKASTGTDYWLPTNLGTNKENMQNFAEMLWAICYPENWRENVTNFHEDGTLWGFSGMPFFTDFKGKNLKYHNEAFWKNVQKGWEGKQVAEKALNLPNLGALLDKINADGVHLLYKGYSWWFTTSWNCELWEAVYTNGTTNAEKNMHHAVYNEEVERNMKDLTFDVRTMGQTTGNYNGFFNNDGKYRWVIRHATGKELASNGKFDVQQPIQGVTEVYRYYAQYPNEWTRQPEDEGKPEIPRDQAATTVTYAMDGCGTYMLGDVVKDEDGSRWFCIAGSPKSVLYPNHTDNRATFVSFDNIKVEGSVATNIIKENELAEVAARFTYLYNSLSGNSIPGGKLTLDNRGLFGEHIYNYAGVDMNKIIMHRDSVWRFQNYNDKRYYDSESTSYFFNLAYYDGQTNRQAIARIITDVTRAGSHRTACNAKSGSRLDHWQYRFYKHYEVFNPDKMEGPNEDEASVGMTLWQSVWASTDDKMYLDDVTSQQMVNKYAAADKWVRLPQPVPNGFEIPGTPRTQAEASVRPEDYLWKNGNFATTKTSIFNEPVLFMRVMYVNDNGGKKPNLVSTDGRHLSIVHLLDDRVAYTSFFQSVWAINNYTECHPIEKSPFWMDNKHIDVTEGWPAM